MCLRHRLVVIAFAMLVSARSAGADPIVNLAITTSYFSGDNPIVPGFQASSPTPSQWWDFRNSNYFGLSVVATGYDDTSVFNPPPPNSGPGAISTWNTFLSLTGTPANAGFPVGVQIGHQRISEYYVSYSFPPPSTNGVFSTWTGLPVAVYLSGHLGPGDSFQYTLYTNNFGGNLSGWASFQEVSVNQAGDFSIILTVPGFTAYNILGFQPQSFSESIYLVKASGPDVTTWVRIDPELRVTFVDPDGGSGTGGVAVPETPTVLTLLALVALLPFAIRITGS